MDSGLPQPPAFAEAVEGGASVQVMQGCFSTRAALRGSQRTGSTTERTGRGQDNQSIASVRPKARLRSRSIGGAARTSLKIATHSVQLLVDREIRTVDD